MTFTFTFNPLVNTSALLLLSFLLVREEADWMCGNSLAELHGGRMGIRPQGALVLNHLGTIELARKKTSLGFREGETSLERAIAAEKVSDCLRGGVCVCAQLCLTLCDTMGYSPPASSVHGTLQTRILEWVAISFSRGSS